MLVCVCVRTCAFNKHLKNTSYRPGLAIGTGVILMSNKSRIPAFMVWKGRDSKKVNKSMNSQLWIAVSAVETIKQVLMIRVGLGVQASLKR